MAVTTQPDPHSLRTSSYEPSLEKEPRNIDDDTQSGQPVLSGNLSDRKGDDVMNKDEDGRLSRATTEEEVYITGFKLMMVVISVTSAAFLMLLDVSIVATATPRITTDFHSLEDVGWYGSAYLLASAAIQPLAGKIYSNFSTKWTFLSFFFIFEVGSLLCGVSQSSKMLIVGRAVAGIGGAGLTNGALTIISCCVPLHKRPTYMGIMQGVAQMGTILGPLLGGAFTQYATWRWCFYINLPIGAIVAISLVLVQIPNNVGAERISVLQTILTKLDLIGFALFAPSAIQFFLALQYGGNQFAWNSATVIGLFCGAGGNFIVFLLWQYYKGEEAMIPFSMLKIRSVWASCVFIFFFFAMIQIANFYLPVYFQAVKGATPMMSGVYLLPSILAQLFAAVSGGAATGKLGYYTPFSLGSAILTAIGHGLLSTFSPSTSTGKWIGYQIIIGAGRGIGLQTPYIAVQNFLPQEMISISMSLLTFNQMLGGSVFLTLGDTVFTNSLRTYLTTYAPSVDPQAVIQAGATGLRSLLADPTELAGVLMAYSKSVDRVFYLAVGCSCGCFLFAWGLGWKDIRKKSKATKDSNAA